MILSVGTAPTLPASNSSLPLFLASVQSVVQKDDMCHTVTTKLISTERNGTLLTSLLGDLIIIKVDTFHRQWMVVDIVLMRGGGGGILHSPLHW